MINKIDTLTNQITYNRLLRASTQILRENVFEFNDSYTRNNIIVKLKALYNKAANFSITEYKLSVVPYDSSKPHYMEVHIEVLFPSMIEYVLLNINNVDNI